MRIAVLLLCHESPAVIAARLGSAFYRSADVKVYLHHDLGSPHHSLPAFEAALAPHVAQGLQWQWLPAAVRGRWGEYSLVEATVRLMEAVLADTAFPADRLFLVSGSCRPIRPLASLQAYLRLHPAIDFIQAHDISRSRWTKDGLEAERFHYWFPFNYQTQRRWFERATDLQRRWKVRRRMPAGLKPHFGSQWFCLRRDTAAGVVGELRRPEIVRFFARSWIPDEFAIQTVVAGLRPTQEIAGHGLTYYEFDAVGKPLQLEDWHVEHLRRQPFFFARKISPAAAALEAVFDAAVATPEADLAYFPRVGRPTPDFEAFVQAVKTDPARRSRLGSFWMDEGGPMAGNQRRYYVLYGSSRPRVAGLLAAARAHGKRPIFDFPFDRSGLRLAADKLRLYGLGPRDRARAQYDPCAVLHELVQLDPHACTAFAIEPADRGWVRDFVAWDPRAVLVNCDPPGLSRLQRAAMSLRYLGGQHETWMTEGTRAALTGSGWLPAEYFEERRDKGTTRCDFASLHDLAYSDDPTWQALTAAAAGLLDDEHVIPGPTAEALLEPFRLNET